MRSVLSAAVLFLLGASTGSAQSAEQWCGTEDQASWLRHRMVQLLDTRDSSLVELRRAVFLPALPVDSIVPVREPAICERAARTYYRHRLGPMPLGGVAVIRVGNRYAVLGRERMGEWTTLVIYTLRFEDLARLAS